MPDDRLAVRRCGRTLLYVQYGERSTLMDGRARSDSTHDAVYVVRASGGPRGTGRELAAFRTLPEAESYLAAYSPKYALNGRWD